VKGTFKSITNSIAKERKRRSRRSKEELETAEELSMLVAEEAHLQSHWIVHDAPQNASTKKPRKERGEEKGLVLRTKS